MFERECRLYRFLMFYAQRLIADIPEEKFTYQPAEGMNHPAWVLGHLGFVADYALGIVGQPALCAPQWSKMFGPGSKPAGTHPGKDVLWSAFERGHRALLAAVPMITPEQAEAANPFTPLLEIMPTAGDLLAHIMTTHEASHLGQLSAWRRMIGLGAVLGI